jgi:uncharacterized protein
MDIVDNTLYGNAPVVMYHHGCADGFCAAWVAHRAFVEDGIYPESWLYDTTYLPVTYQEPLPPLEVYADRPVYILDFSFPRDKLLEICRNVPHLTLLDHHKSAQTALENFPLEVQRYKGGVCRTHITFDMTKSGALLAWEYFFPSKIKEVPWIIRYVMDRDLWQWRLPLSREVNLALYSYPFDFETWDDLHRYSSHTTLASQGKHIKRFQDKLIDQGVRHAPEVMLAGYRVRAFNTPYFRSEIAGALAEGRPFGVCWSMHEDGRYVFDLRSHGDQGIDVSKIAIEFGGGGHKAAAGFTVDKLPFEVCKDDKDEETNGSN